MEITPEIQAVIDEQVKGLKNKNDELLGKLDKFKGLDIDKLVRDSATLAEFLKKSDEEKGEYKKLYEQLRDSSGKDVEKLNKQIEELTNNITGMKKSSAITKALSDISVDPLLLDLAVKTISEKAAVDDKGNVMVDGKDLPKFVKEWADTDLGKRFIISGNSGGGANGGVEGGPDGHAKFFDPKSEHYNVTEQAKLAKTNVSEYNRLKAIYKK